MTNPTRKVVTLLPAAPFLLELRSERMIDAILALNEAGFRVTHVAKTANRFRIEDNEEQSNERCNQD